MSIPTAIILFAIFLVALYWAEHVPTDKER